MPKVIKDSDGKTYDASSYFMCRLRKGIDSTIPGVRAFPPLAATIKVIGAKGQRVWGFLEATSDSWVIMAKSGRVVTIPENRISEFVEALRHPETNARLIDESDEPKTIHAQALKGLQ